MDFNFHSMLKASRATGKWRFLFCVMFLPYRTGPKHTPAASPILFIHFILPGNFFFNPLHH